MSAQTANHEDNVFTVTINQVEIKFNASWERCDGDGWKFFVQTTVFKDCLRQCDDIRTSTPINRTYC